MTGTTLTQGYSHMNTNRKELLVVTLTLVHLDNPNVAVKKKKKPAGSCLKHGEKFVISDFILADQKNLTFLSWEN